MNKIYPILLFLIPFCCNSSYLHAQEKKVSIKVKVLDSFSRDFLKDAKIELFEADSTTVVYNGSWGFIHITTTASNTDYEKIEQDLTATIPYRNTYIAKVSAKNYDRRYVRIDMPSRYHAEMSWKSILLDRSESFYEHTLGEASVTASRIAMVVKGDTIEYDARAFRLSSGSMLDDLMKRLNGVTISDDGQIYLNGKYVSKLLLNGRDFFDGDPKVALQNLPAYAVDKVKFYNESKKYAYLFDEKNQPKKDDNPNLVVDIKLKKDYAVGWLGNVEVGGGSQTRDQWDSKYMARLFGLRYTKNSNLAFYNSINNLGDNQSPGRKGEWKRMDVTQGESTTRTGGLNFNLTGKNTGIGLNTSVEVLNENSLLTNSQTSEQRIGESTFRSTSTNAPSNDRTGKSKRTELKWKGNIYAPLPKVYIEFMPTLNYTSGRNHNEYAYSYDELRNGNFENIYQRTVYNHSDSKNLKTRGDLSSTFKSPLTGKNFKVNVSYLYYHESKDAQTKDAYLYTDAANNQQFNWNEAFPRHGYEYNFGLGRNLISERTRKANYGMDLALAYWQAYQTDNKYRYEMDEADSLSNNAGLLPSFWRHFENTLNADRSYRSATFERKYESNLQFNMERKWWGVNINMDWQLVNRKYTRYMGMLWQSADRKDIAFYNSMNLHIRPLKGYLIYTVSNDLAPMEQTIEIADFTTPYFLYYGNEKLKNTITHTLQFLRSDFNSDKQRATFFSMAWDKVQNAIGYEMTYSPASNQTVCKARNIQGNWNLRSNLDWSQPIDRHDKLMLSTKTQFNWKHSVDYSQVDLEEMTRSVVDNMQATENLSLTYSTMKGYHIGLKGDFTYYWQKARTRAYKNHAIDYDYGITLSIPFNSHLDFETDMLAYTRAGYSDKTFNSTDWVWNASLSYAWGKKNQWLVRAMGFDILHQLSSVKRVINEQGFTETRYNTVPSYALLTLVYRFSKAPKGQK